MKLILISWVKYYTKEMFKTLKILTIGSAIILTVVFIKYKPAYEVTVSGETIGFVNDKNLIEIKIDKYINDDSANITFRELAELPQYELKFITRDKKTEEKDIMLAIENLTTTTYKNYVITINGKKSVIVDSQKKAEDIINEIESDLQEGVDLNLGLIGVYETADSSIEVENAKGILSEYKVAKVNEYQAQKEEEERIARENEIKNAKTKSRVKSIITTATSAPTGTLNGLALAIPVNGSISSRFGARSRIRSSAHTGLDIAASLGTGIRPIAPGTVKYAGYKGSYGNLIIIDHGNGIESYYAHCRELYVSAGQNVAANSTIGSVGSTGNSTGPHLHLEIRINGTIVNPQNYLY